MERGLKIMDGKFMGGRFCNLHNIQKQPTNSSSTANSSFYSYPTVVCSVQHSTIIQRATLLLDQRIALCIVVMIH